MVSDRMARLMGGVEEFLVEVEGEEEEEEECWEMENGGWAGRVRIAKTKALALQKVREECEDPRVMPVFTDGSRILASPQTGWVTASGAAVVLQGLDSKGTWVEEATSLPQVQSSLSAELWAIARALELAQVEPARAGFETFYTGMIVTMMTDCQPALEQIRKLTNEASLVPEALDLLTLLRIREGARLLNDMGVAVDFMWVPGHSGIRANERADRMARHASKFAVNQIRPGTFAL